MSDKAYDRRYFDRWYHNPTTRVASPAGLRRKVHLAVAAAEAVLGRPLRSTLDLGCGEGRWQPVLAKLRSSASYLGLDPSDYAVERYGQRRNLIRGSFEDHGGFVFDRTFDLVVCSDVLHYLTEPQIAEGLRRLVPLLGGVAFLEVFTSADDIEGDHEGFHLRSADLYRCWFAEAGLVPCGWQTYVTEETAAELPALTLPDASSRPQAAAER